MAQEDGTPWRFYVVIRKEDKTYVRHDSMMKAVDEAERLCKKEKATFNVLELVGRFEVADAPVIWREPSRP
jgi:hypothetical protein